MFKLKEADEKFLMDHVPGIDEVIAKGDKMDIQDEFYTWMDVNCFDEKSDGSFNKLGEEAQDVWDSIRNTD